MKLKSTLIVLSLIAAPAFASDQAVSKTREQVRAELAQAQRESSEYRVQYAQSKAQVQFLQGIFKSVTWFSH